MRFSPANAPFQHHPHHALDRLSCPLIGLYFRHVQTGDTEDRRGPVLASEMARHVLRLHYEEQQRRVANRVSATIIDIHHSWCIYLLTHFQRSHLISP